MPIFGDWLFLPIAQVAAVGGQDPRSAITAWFVLAPAILLVLIPALLLFLYVSRRKREQQHLERMKAIEMGRPLPAACSFWSAGKLAAGMGLALPVFALYLAYTMSDAADIHTDLDIAKSAWIAAGLVSVAGIIGATLLMLQGGGSVTGSTITDASKPGAIDPDEFDTTSSRGWTEPVGRTSNSHTA